MINQMLAAVEQRHREADSPASQGQFQAGIAIGLLIAELESDARRKGIFSTVKTTLKTLWERYEKLSQFPRQEVINFLQNLLTFNNLCVLDIDIAFQWKQSRVEVVRLAAIDRDGNVLFHDALNKERSGMTPVWEELRALLTGRFILAHDLELTQLLLSSTAEYYGLDTPILIGASFAILCQEYFERGIDIPRTLTGSEGIPRSSLVDALGTGQGAQTALDHVRTMLRLVQRMAEGAWDVHETTTSGSAVSE